MDKLTQEYLKECLTYDPDTGIFTRKERPTHHFKDDNINTADSICRSWNTKYAHRICNFIGKNGYIQITINYKSYYAHRLAFLYMKGYMPENMVDHIDRDKLSNKWNNLREVSRTCNSQNCKVRSDNKSGVVGISRIGNKWDARICVNKKVILLGMYSNFDDAVLARYKEEQNNINWNCSKETSSEKYLKKNNLI